MNALLMLEDGEGTSTQRLTPTQGLTHNAVQSHPRWYGDQGKGVDKIG